MLAPFDLACLMIRRPAHWLLPRLCAISLVSAMKTIKDATVRRFYYENRSQLRQHLADFNFGCGVSRRSSSFAKPGPPV
jgi:hypothetical protein